MTKVLLSLHCLLISLRTALVPFFFSGNLCCTLTLSPFCLRLSVYIRKLSDDERPLRLRLCSGPNEKVLSFVLKENETGEVNVSAA